ncbi:Cof-like hydrolase [Prevotella sp. DNF00663]|uniref:Cof-type HAD-IIB family hydrolase n=1 Tax=unclassified Prevotella TaxID=2638335 RepID=UPI00079CBEC7|nr:MULTISPECIES: Cof-type HAD-IIB family hydrolase [unclassified Prevotella]KXB84777.1 Cof-like hydrolase [Prevotella sp. DNF00663]
MKKIKDKYAIFSDIDGTLVSFTTHEIPRSAVEAITAARQNGHRFYISTGRPVPIITNLGAISHLIDGYITTNGAHCFVGDKLVNINAIAEEDVCTQLADADRQDYAVIMVSKQALVVYNNKPCVKRIFCDDLKVDALNFDLTMDDIKGEPILQMTPFVTAEQEARLIPQLKSCEPGRWHPEFIDITAGHIDKGYGLERMAESEGFDINHTVALGDGGNDIPILKRAGIGVAMGNAADYVKAEAQYVTADVDDDGFSKALIHLGLV